MTAQTITFYLQLNINAGEYYHPVEYSASPVFTLVVVCGPKSSSHDANPGSFSGSLGTT